jgi:hypothetical protein
VFTTALHWSLTLSQTDPVHTALFYLSKIHLNIIHLATYCSSSGLFPLNFNILCKPNCLYVLTRLIQYLAVITILTFGKHGAQSTLYVCLCLTFRRVCVKYIAAAMERLKEKHSVAERDLSLLERILAGDPDPSTACILALDLILVGIDTVSSCIVDT